MQTKDIRGEFLQVIDIIAPGCLPDVVDDDLDIREQMDLDSMDMLSIVEALHERLGVEVPESDVEQLTTINSAVTYLSQSIM